MTSLVKARSRTAAVSVAIAMFATSLASAQTPNSTSTPVDTTHGKLLSETAFGRLVQKPRPNVPLAKVEAKAPGPSLLRQATNAATRSAQAPAPKTAATQGSWASRHKWAILIPVMIGGGLFLAWAIAPDDQ